MFGLSEAGYQPVMRSMRAILYYRNSVLGGRRWKSTFFNSTFLVARLIDGLRHRFFTEHA